MREYIARILIWQARRGLQKWQPLVIVIAGSVGKTTTTQAVADMLSGVRRVRSTLHNYNSDVGVPCSIFGQYLPETLKNPFAWINLMFKNELALRQDAAFDTLVLELGTDKPGEISQFSYLNPSIAVVTAVAPEHMEFFGTIDAVAEEELSVADYSAKTGCNKHLVDSKYTKDLDVAWFDSNILKKYSTKPKILGIQGEQIAAAAVWVAEEVAIGKAETEKGIARLSAQPRRMQLLKGINGSVIIDDTYNASPEAYAAAFKYFYAAKAPFKIALVGNMNELGDTSEQAHTDLGNLCHPKKLDIIITLGKDANEYTADMAEKRGCKTIRTTTPYQAAEVIREELKRYAKSGALILCKGSQNGVFAEESVKLLLADKADEARLVRQSSFWLKKKKASISKAVDLRRI